MHSYWNSEAVKVAQPKHVSGLLDKRVIAASKPQHTLSSRAAERFSIAFMAQSAHGTDVVQARYIARYVRGRMR